jgi:hypothetical protein
MSAGESRLPGRTDILNALGSYQKRGRIADDVEGLANMLVDESDRGVVVILGSMVEDILLERLLEQFGSLTPAQTKNLARAGGLLNNFDHRITLAHAMGLIDEEMVETLQTVKAMRNACAHSRLDITFGTPELRDTLALLFDAENAQEIRDSRSPVAQRIMFLVAFIYIHAILNGHAPEVAEARGQEVMDGALMEAAIAAEKHRASLGRRRQRRAERLRNNPNG